MRTQIALLGCLMGLLFSTSAGNSNAPARIVVVMPTRVPSGLSAAEAAPRAHDPESSPNPSNAVTATDGAVTVRVRDEAGLARAGARVYHNGEYVGRTGHAGTMGVRDVAVGDQLAALHQVYERPSVKRHYGFDGSGDWAWRIYQTSVSIADDGQPLLFQVEDASRIQELTVHSDQTLVGFHLVVSVEWDADGRYLADLSRGLEQASALLYDVGNGQFFWELIEVFDDRTHWAGCDMCILASNRQWPEAHMWGITHGRGTRITLGRYFNGDSSNSGGWALENGVHAMVHEFAHYGLGLHDEYLNAEGNRVPPSPTGLTGASKGGYDSIMWAPYVSTELGTWIDRHYPHGKRTLHYAETAGRTPWATVLRHFADSARPARWTVQSPVSRRAIVPGPDAIPVDDWMKVIITDQDTGACLPFEIEATTLGNGAPMGEAEVWVDRRSPSPLPLRQGETDQSGRVVIYGAHPGDTLIVRKGRSAAAIRVSCPASLRGGQELTAATTALPWR